MSRINGVYLPVLQLIGFLGKVIILGLGGWLIVSGKMRQGVGAVVAAFLYWDWFMNPILNFGNFYNLLMQAMAGAERVFSLLDLKPEVQDLPAATPLPPIVGRVTFDHVTFGYDPERPVLHDVSFEATPGQMIALVGATGSGKSSIISLIARFYQPQQRPGAGGWPRHSRGDRRVASPADGSGSSGQLSLHRHGDGEYPLCPP